MASLDPGQDMVFDSLYGLEFGETTAEHMTATCPVTPKILQPFGIVHGGVFCSMAETIASVGTYLGVKDAGNLAVGDVQQHELPAPDHERHHPRRGQAAPPRADDLDLGRRDHQ